MKKFIVFLLTLMMGFCTLNVSAQQTVEIGTGTGTTYYGPFNSLWGYSFVEQIYTAEEIDMAGSITSISFNNSSAGQTNNITVYMKLVTRTSFTSSTDYETVTAADIVYTGSHNFSNGWSTITLDTPFDYDGVSNLMIAVHEYTSGYSTQYFYYTSTPNALISFHSDSADPDPYNLGSYSGTIYTQSYRNNIQLEIMPSGSNCYAPLAPAISDITAYEATLSWTPREGQSAWEVYCGTGVVDLEQVSWTPVTDTFYTFTGLTPATNYTAYVRTNCGTEVSNPRQVPFATEATCASVPSSVTVSGITATTANVDWAAGADDYAWEVVVVPANAAPETGTPEQTSSHPYTVTNLQDNTQYKVYVRTDCGSGDHSYWSSPASFTTLPFCSAPLNVTVSQITANSALVSWQPAVFGANDYTVEYSVAGEDIWTQVIVDGTQLMLSGLEPDSTYNVMVYSNCDIGTGDTVNKTFITKHCLAGGDVAIGEGTNTSSYFPEYCLYNNSYTQQLFTAAELGGANTFHSISFHISTLANANRDLVIYLMHTTATSVGTGIDVSNAQVVYSQTGTTTLTAGWNNFTFTTPFTYNGTDNLLVVVIDRTGSYSGTNYWTGHTVTSGISCYDYDDYTTYSINTLPDCSSSSFRNNVIFGGDCDNDVTCVRPNVYVSETSESSVTLDWAPGYTESAWDVEYSVDNITWNSAGTANAHPYEVANLNSDTRYYFRVRSNCGGEESDWSGANARTECGPITQLPYFNNFDEVIMDNGTAFITCWSRYTTNPDRVVRCYGSATHSGSYSLDFNYSPSCTTAAVTPMIDPSIPLNMVMLDFWAYSGLGQGWMEVGTMSDPNDFSTYEFYDTVRLAAAGTWENLIISFENYTGSNQYIAFLEINGTTTSYIFDDFTINYSTNCFHPTNLAVDALTNTSVTLSWTEAGSATAWEIEYGPTGFAPGNGTTVTADANPFTVDNLTPATTYDFYVSANCGSEISSPFGPVSATPGQYVFGVTGSDTLTACDLVLYDDGGPNANYSGNCDFTLVLYPEDPDAMMALTGISNTESNYDYLKIYDGVGTGNQVLNLSGSNQTVNVISTTGPLTIKFTSDGSVFYAGFELHASCVTCFPPTNVTASNPTIDGATVTWSGNGDSYVLFLNGDMTTGYDATDMTYTFTGLNSSSVYSVQVAAICNGDTSMLSSATTFATACDAITITADNSWTEDFENYVGGGAQQFICWATPVTEVVDNGTSPFVYCGYSQACHSGQNSAELKGTSNMLALPEFTNDIADLRLSFWATVTNTSSPGSMDVGYMTDINDPTTFVVLADAGTPGPRGSSGSSAGNGNYMGPFDFNGVTATGARIALRFNGASGLSWNLDDFTVELIPGCPSPVKTSVTASNIGGHVATISWTDNDATHSAWTVYYKETAGSEWSTTPATDTFVVLTGLDPLTQYDVYVVTNCGTAEVNPDATHTIHFTTTVACPAPTGLTLASVTTDEATITWNGTASSYNVEYGVTGFTPGTGTEAVVSTESITLTNLDPSTNYTVYVNSDCTAENDSLSTTVSFSFNTTQIPAPLPYTADFTQASEWILNNGTCTNYWAVGAINATPSLFVTNNGTTPNYSTGSYSVVSAEKLLAVGDNASVLISFDVYVGGEGTSSYSYDYLKVFFAPAETEYPANSTSSTPTYATYAYETNAANFQNYLSQTGCSYNPYKLSLTNDTLHVEIEMPNPYADATSASAAKLVFLWRNDGSSGTQPGAIISNVSVSVNSCPMPSNIAVTNVTSNSVTLSWTPGDEETSWEIAYGPAGFDPDDNSATVVTANTNPFDVQNLDPATTYEFYIRAICSPADQSAWVSLGSSVITPCSGAVAIPYTEDFESYAGTTYTDANGIAPACWTTYSNNTTYGAPHITGSGSYHYVHSGTNCMVFTCGSAGADAYAALPEFDQPLNTLHLNFWRAMESTSSGTLTVGYVTDLSDMNGSFVTVATIPSVSSSSGDTISVDFTDASVPASGNICFHWSYSSSYYSCCIDDINVILAGSGPGPVVTDPTVATDAATNIAQTSATLNGTITNPDNVTITAKGFEWKTTTGGTYQPVNVTGNNLTYNLTNLTPNTGYTYKAFITYNGTTVYGSEMTFTTLEQGVEPCNVPTNLHTTAVENHAINIAWDADASVSSWNIQYRTQNGQWSTATSNTNSYNITGLEGLTTYEIQVQANCGSGNLSDWSGSITATTTNVGIEEHLLNSITLYPNPANDVVNVQCTMYNVQLEGIEVIDVYGKVVRTVVGANNDSPTQINVSGLAAGMYFVRVTTDQGTVTKTFIKK